MARKSVWRICIASIILLAILTYGGGFISQFLRNYTIWQEGGGIPGDGTSPKLPSAAIPDCVRALFHWPYGLMGVGVGIICVAILCFLVLHMGEAGGGAKDHSRNFLFSAKGTYGTAGFMDAKEAEEVLDFYGKPRKPQGVILGELDRKVVCLPQKSEFCGNIAVYGASGSRKTRGYCVNTILQKAISGESQIILDCKGELYSKTAEYLRVHKGYTVRVFNLVDPLHSDAWNILGEIEGDERNAQLMAEIIVGNKNGKEPIWPLGEKSLFQGLALLADEMGGDMGTVADWIANKSLPEIEELFSPLPPGHPARFAYGLFSKADPKVQSGIAVGLGFRLQLFQSQLIRQITTHPEIDLELPGKEKCAYYIISSDQDSTFEFLTCLFLSYCFVKLIRLADRSGGELPVPVHILGEELTNIVGTIPDLEKKVSTIRSRRLSISLVFQGIGQLQNRYPFGVWQELLGGCDVQLFMGCNDPATAEHVSAQTGLVTVDVDSRSKMLNTWRVSNYTPEYRETSSVGKRPLFNPDEIRRLPLDKALVLLRGRNVLLVDKYDYSKHPEASRLIPSAPSEHIPQWVTAARSQLPFQPIKRPEQPSPDMQPPPSKKVVAVDRDDILSL